MAEESIWPTCRSAWSWACLTLCPPMGRSWRATDLKGGSQWAELPALGNIVTDSAYIFIFYLAISLSPFMPSPAIRTRNLGVQRGSETLFLHVCPPPPLLVTILALIEWKVPGKLWGKIWVLYTKSITILLNNRSCLPPTLGRVER